MVRKMVQLTEEQSKKLVEQAKEQGVSISELVRRGVDMVLASSITNAEARKRALSVIGIASGPADLSEKHDQYFAEGNGH